MASNRPETPLGPSPAVKHVTGASCPLALSGPGIFRNFQSSFKPGAPSGSQESTSKEASEGGFRPGHTRYSPVLCP